MRNAAKSLPLEGKVSAVRLTDEVLNNNLYMNSNKKRAEQLVFQIYDHEFFSQNQVWIKSVQIVRPHP